MCSHEHNKFRFKNWKSQKIWSLGYSVIKWTHLSGGEKHDTFAGLFSLIVVLIVMFGASSTVHQEVFWV